MSAENCKIVLLSGTPIINYPNEIAIFFNILRGYIKTWNLVLDIKTAELPLMISDEYFGEVEVFYNKVTKSFVRNPLTRKISVEYQGCAEKKYCYPMASTIINVAKIH